MSKLAPDDERLLHRFVDGELPDTAITDFRRRLEREPGLRQQLQQLQDLRACFRQDAGSAIAAPAGFTAGLLTTIRQRTLNQSWRDDADAEPQLLRLCRRLLIAAAVLVGLAAIWQAGVLRHIAPKQVEASNELRQLDALIRADSMRTPAATESRR